MGPVESCFPPADAGGYKLHRWLAMGLGWLVLGVEAFEGPAPAAQSMSKQSQRKEQDQAGQRGAQTEEVAGMDEPLEDRQEGQSPEDQFQVIPTDAVLVPGVFTLSRAELRSRITSHTK